MSALSDKMVEGLEDLGLLAMNVESLAFGPDMSESARKAISELASKLADKIDALRTLARTIV